MYEELKKRLAIWVNLLANEEGDNVVEAIAAIETLEAQLVTANARVEELKAKKPIDDDTLELLKNCLGFFDTWYMENDEIQKVADELQLKLSLLVDAYLFGHELEEPPRKLG